MAELQMSSAGLIDDGSFFDQLLQCDSCEGFLVRRFWWDSPDIPMDFMTGEIDPLVPKTIRIEPAYIKGQKFPDVPAQISAAAAEAHKSASIGNRMSAILMARTVIEATAKDKGITKGMLQAKIEAMLKEGLLRQHIKESADEIRHFGNDMAHGDIGKPVDDDDVAEVLALMDEVLNEVYQSHARLAKVREKRLAKKSGSV